MKLRHSARTDVGKTRDHNEDSYGVGDDEQARRLGELLVICDGMGGHAAGEVASQIGVQTILTTYYGDSSEDRPHVLEQAFEQANEEIFAHGHGSMGTTGVAALLHHDALHIANVGDSRAYLLRDGELRQISRDHSFVGDQVAAGLITADQARLSPHRNVITRALGYQSGVTVDLFRLPLQLGDIVVLSSDGLHGLVTDAEIAEIASSAAPDQAVQQLVDLANTRGGTDNITVVIAQVDALEWISSATEELDTLDERVTRELEPTTELTAPPPAATAPPPAPIAPPPVAAAPTERRLTWLGGLLAVVLLAVLLGVVYLSVSAPTAPTADTPPATPAPATPTLQSTSAPATPAPATPTPQSTRAPATPAPTLQSTSAPATPAAKPTT